jgi:hypothetical protein
MLQAESLFAAIVPDVNTLTAQSLSTFPSNLDLKNDGESYGTFSYAV